MKIKILFSYVQNVVPPRCRNPRAVRFHDGELELEIPEIHSTDAPVAIRCTSNREFDEVSYQLEYRWWGNRLWTNWKSHCGKPLIDKDSLKPNFHPSITSVIDLRGDGHLENWSFGIYLSKVMYSKEEAITCLNNWLRSELIIDGERYLPCGEPHYVVKTFGIGQNHGGTACVIDSTNDHNNCDSSVFSLLEREKAIVKATEVATRRQDTKSLPIEPHGPDWEVLIPEAIQIKPLEQRVRKFVGHIKTDKEGSSCEFEFEVSVTASGEEIEKEAREAAFNHVEWSYRQV